MDFFIHIVKQSQLPVWYGLLGQSLFGLKSKFHKMDRLVLDKSSFRFEIKGECQVDLRFQILEKISFDSSKDFLALRFDGKEKQVSLKSFHLSFEEIQRIKSGIRKFEKERF